MVLDDLTTGLVLYAVLAALATVAALAGRLRDLRHRLRTARVEAQILYDGHMDIVTGKGGCAGCSCMQTAEQALGLEALTEVAPRG